MNCRARRWHALDVDGVLPTLCDPGQLKIRTRCFICFADPSAVGFEVGQVQLRILVDSRKAGYR